MLEVANFTTIVALCLGATRLVLLGRLLLRTIRAKPVTALRLEGGQAILHRLHTVLELAVLLLGLGGLGLERLDLLLGGTCLRGLAQAIENAVVQHDGQTTACILNEVVLDVRVQGLWAQQEATCRL